MMERCVYVTAQTTMRGAYPTGDVALIGQRECTVEATGMTVREIAGKAGVSIGTVDRVLHNRGRVSPGTKASILAIIEQSGYTPNPIARHLKLNKKYPFAVIMPALDEDSGYWRIAGAGVQKAQRELAAFGVSVKRFEFNRYAQASFARAMAAFDPLQFAGLLIAPVIPGETTALLSRLPLGYPVVFFDAQIPSFTPLTRIGQNAYQSGLLAGRLMEAFSCRSGPYVIVSTHSEDYHISKRIEGFKAYFSGRPYEVQLRECFDIEHREKREHFTRLLLQEFSSIDGVFVTNASVHGIAADLNTRESQKHITVVGYDLVPENVRQIEAKTIDCIISQRQEQQGYQGIYQLYRSVVLGQPVEPEIEMPIDIHLRENLPAGLCAEPQKTEAHVSRTQ
jgi:LacI family transcriptional regulator